MMPRATRKMRVTAPAPGGGVSKARATVVGATSSTIPASTPGSPRTSAIRAVALSSDASPPSSSYAEKVDANGDDGVGKTRSTTSSPTCIEEAGLEHTIPTRATVAATGKPRPRAGAPGSVCGKNLRWTAVALAAKMRRERERLSLHVADEVAAEAARETRLSHPSKDVSSVERNTRRRVYDALKVMVAVGVIRRFGKSLTWVGYSHHHQQKQQHQQQKQQQSCEKERNGTAGNDCVNEDGSATKSDISEIRAAITTKRANAQRLRTAIASLEALTSAHPPSSPDCALSLPFILVRGAKVKQLLASSTRDRMRIRLDGAFRLYSETDIAQLLTNMHKNCGSPSATTTATRDENVLETSPTTGAKPCRKRPRSSAKNEQMHVNAGTDRELSGKCKDETGALQDSVALGIPALAEANEEDKQDGKHMEENKDDEEEDDAVSSVSDFATPPGRSKALHRIKTSPPPPPSPPPPRKRRRRTRGTSGALGSVRNGTAIAGATAR